MARIGRDGRLAPERAGAGTAGQDRLSALRIGCEARICGLDGNLPQQVARRLLDLGFRPGVQVTCVRRAPLGSPTVYRVGEADICLRRTQASAVMVQGARS